MTETIDLTPRSYQIDPSDPKCPRCGSLMKWNWYARETYVCVGCGWEYKKVKGCRC